MGLHSKQTLADGVHGIVALEYANAAVRLAAAGFVASDVYKIARDLDTSQLFILVNHSPITWKDIGNASVGQDLNKVEVDIIKASAGTVARGTPIYRADWDAANDRIKVEKAYSESTGAYACVGIVSEQATDTVAGKMLILGILHDLDTSALAVGPIYLGTAAGSLVNAAPDGPNITQSLGQVIHSDANGHLGISIEVPHPLDYSGVPEGLGIAAWGTSNLGSPSSHVHAPPVFGSDYQREESMGESSTTSTTFQSKVTLTTPALTGTYRIGWSARVWQSGVADRLQAQLYNDTDAAVLSGPFDFEPEDADDRHLPSASREVVFDGSAKTFIVQYRQQDGGTAYIDQASIEFWRVG